MDNNTWTWAFSLVLDAVVSLFGSAITVLGVATVSLLVLLWLHTLVRLIVRPIVGMALGDVYGDINKRMTKNNSMAYHREQARKQLDREKK